MTITYAFSRREITRWSWNRYMRHILPSSTCLFVIGAGVVWSGAGVVALAPFLGIILLLMVVSTPFKAWNRISQMISDDPDALGPMTVDFDDKGFRYFQPNWRGEMPWSLFGKVQEDKTFIYISQRSGDVPALLVPKNAFASPEDMATFLRFANAGVTKAH